MNTKFTFLAQVAFANDWRQGKYVRIRRLTDELSRDKIERVYAAAAAEIFQLGF